MSLTYPMTKYDSVTTQQITMPTTGFYKVKISYRDVSHELLYTNQHIFMIVDAYFVHNY